MGHPWPRLTIPTRIFLSIVLVLLAFGGVSGASLYQHQRAARALAAPPRGVPAARVDHRAGQGDAGGLRDPPRPRAHRARPHGHPLLARRRATRPTGDPAPRDDGGGACGAARAAGRGRRGDRDDRGHARRHPAAVRRERGGVRAAVRRPRARRSGGGAADARGPAALRAADLATAARRVGAGAVSHRSDEPHRGGGRAALLGGGRGARAPRAAHGAHRPDLVAAPPRPAAEAPAARRGGGAR